MSGGTTQKADDKRIYVVRANGSIEAGSGSRWFRADAADPAWRHDRRAARRGADEAAADVDRGDVDHLQPRRGGRGGEFILMTIETPKRARRCLDPARLLVSGAVNRISSRLRMSYASG